MHKKFWKPIRQTAMRFDGDAGGGSATGTTTPATGGAGSTASTNAGNGTLASTSQTTPTAQTQAPNTTPYKSFASEADYQKEVDFKVQQALKTHEEKLKGKLTPEIRKQLEAEANMTAEQKVQAQLDQLESEKKELAKEKVRIKVESLFASKGIAEEDRAPMLDSIVDDNEEESMKRGQALISAMEHNVNEQIKTAMKKVTPPDGGSGAGDGKGKDKAVEYAKSLAEKRAASTKASNSALDYYIHGGKRV